MTTQQPPLPVLSLKNKRKIVLKEASVEEIVVNNRAQIMEMRDQVSGMEKRIYEFKRSSLLAQIKSQGVVLRALAENLQEPLKGKALSLSTHLSQF